MRWSSAAWSYEGAREYWTPRRLTLDIARPAGRAPPMCARSARARAPRPKRRSRASCAVPAFLRSIRGAGQRSEEGRFLRRHHLQARPGDGCEIIAEIVPGHHPRFPWPKSMRWGKASRQPAPACAGCARCTRSLHLRRRDRGTGGHSLRGRRHRRLQHHLRPPLPCAGRDHRQAFRRLRVEPGEGQGRARCRPPQGDHPARRRDARLRARASNWSRMRACWKRSPGWSNGRSC
jgi:hypothetical protein